MNEEQFGKLIQQLSTIGGKLDTLIALQKSNAPKKNLSHEEKKVLDLCNGKNTIDAIASKTAKTKDNVRATLSNLRGKGLVESEKIGGKQIYSRI